LKKWRHDLWSNDIRPKVVQEETLGAWIIKLITAVIYGFRKKLECLSLAVLSSLV
jgi:hypothetical protein